MYTFAEKNNKQQKSNSNSFYGSGKAQFKPHSFGNVLQRKCACGGPHSHSGDCEECKKKKLLQRKQSNILQPKLKFNTPGDIYEKEADAMADKVMRMKIPELDNKIKRKNDEEGHIQRKETAGEISPDSHSLVNDVLNSSGKPLDEETRAFMEPRFGYDFSNVRIHDDAKSAESASAVNALAYTAGNSVVFNRDKYNPTSISGKQLLSHELTHVIQQNSSMNASHIQTSYNQTVSDYSYYDSNKKNISVSIIRQGMIQREEGVRVRDVLLAANDPKALIGKVWLGLEQDTKAAWVDKAIEAAIQLIDYFPAEKIGGAWIFVKEGLLGFYYRLKSAAQEEKILAMDKIARIITGESLEYFKGLLVGLAKGFFLDGLLGIFIAIWELAKGLIGLWDFFKRIAEAIGGFPEEIQNLIKRFETFGKEIAEGIGPAIDEVKKLVADPKQVSTLVFIIVEKGRAYAKQTGGYVAEKLISFFSKPVAEAEIGEVTGRLTGMVLFEALLTILTAGGGAAVTAAKGATKSIAGILSKFVGKIVSGVLKAVEEIKFVFDEISDVVRTGVIFLKGKLGELGSEFSQLLADIGEFFTKILKNCHESKLVCNFEVLHKMRLPIKPAKFLKGSKLNATLLEDVLQKRNQLYELEGENSWNRNIASAIIKVDGEIKMFTEVNIPNELHSEHFIFRIMEDLEKSGHKVEGIELYSERIPCTESACKPASLKLFETVSYHIGDPIKYDAVGIEKNAEALKLLYGVKVK